MGTIHLFNVFMPLIRQGAAKKVIALTTGMADMEVVRQLDIDIAPPYAISKAALNTAVAKFSAQYRREGILFMSISPGVVDTGNVDPAKRMFTLSIFSDDKNSSYVMFYYRRQR